MKQKPEQHAPLVDLVSIEKGEQGTIVRIDGDESLKRRIQELGLVKDAVVQVLQVNGSILCQISNSRLILDRQTASHILVKPSGS